MGSSLSGGGIAWSLVIFYGLIMKKNRTKYTDESIGKIKVVSDFLPKPKDLVLKEKTVKVTLLLTEESIAFFKKEAATNQIQYQKMIRNLLHQYAHHYKSHNGKKKALA